MRSARRAISCLLGVLTLGLACKSNTTQDPVSRVTIEDPAQYWIDEGFVAMVPPVRLPSTSALLDDVTVWLRLPEDGVITTHVAPSGSVTLEFPPGTRSDRVESRGKAGARVVIDVRGTRIDEHGAQWMHTLRRAAKGRDHSLFGYAWPRADASAHDRATQRLLDELAERPPGKQMRADKRERYLASIERKNQCAGCHTLNRPTNTLEGQHGLVNRGTDASGFFTPQTVLLDRVVLERYGKLDPNLDDPALTITCPDGAQTAIIERNSRVRAECPERAVPLAVVDLGELEASRARAVCRGRRYLHQHLDAEGRQLFAAVIQACDLVTGSADQT